MAHGYPYFDSDYIPASEYIPPLRVCIDNDTCDECTLVKVDGANRRNILLKMVQVLSDLDLIISKSYISSDGDWFMDVFHVTDLQGHKLRDPSIIQYIQQALDIAQKQKGSSGPAQVKICNGNIVGVDHFTSDYNALEVAFIDRPGILSEIVTMLFELSCAMDSGEVWAHNGHVACILYIKEQGTGLPILDRTRLIYLGDYMASIMEAHHFPGELWGVRVRSPTACRIHTERRLHQMLQQYKDYDIGPPPLPVEGDQLSLAITIMEANKRFGHGNASNRVVSRPQVSVESWRERDCLVVNVRSSDRPKLMFDTVCALTDLDYDVFHGSINTDGSVAIQEYFVRQMNECTSLNEMERQSLVRSLAAAVERRMSQGLKVEVRTLNHRGLLSNMSRVLRENSLSLDKALFSKEEDIAVGTFYIIDSSSSTIETNIDQQRLEALRNEIGGDIVFEKKNDCSIKSPVRRRWNLFSMFYTLGRSLVCIDNDTCDECTLVKVDGANRRNILLKMVQVLSDLDLIISKSYISSDGDWFMDVFHVTELQGHKLRDPSIIQYIQQSLGIAQRQKGSSGPAQVKICNGNVVGVDHFTSDCNALEVTFLDRPGILCEVVTVLFKLSCTMDSGEVWAHNGRVACILYIKEQDTGLPILDRTRLIYLGDDMASIMEAHHFPGELWGVRVRSPTACRIHTERRLHQMLQQCKDYDIGPPPLPVEGDQMSLAITIMEANKRFGYGNASNKVVSRPQVSVESWRERDCLVVNVRSSDRPKLMFDTMCALTDLDYDVFHGSINTDGSVAIQEYFVRQMNESTLLNEMERQRLVRNLAAAVERRMSQGLKVEVRTLNRHGLLSNMSRVLRENSLSVDKALFSKEEDTAIGTFYITDSSSSTIDTNNIDQQRLEALRNEIGEDIVFEKNNDCSIKSPIRRRWNLFSMFYNLGRNLWTHIKRLFCNISFIR
ncbi:hypothetical protein IEQ34_022038 [Dendrobium chrysotoxum]|uniref:ACT domain-containing protein ACR n=1 Tax=Dendrobium chrysotoxum TaxID=161865 RepID=A0AAV7FXS8_DENCH|nr:hypothetical protein IEQ34_022038 [Dendrobium chrysotoxum]